jgi:trans-aconitate methyltransferase
VTRLLAERWPGADITGLDSSPAMLERARSVLPGVRFDQAGVEHWEPEEPLICCFPMQPCIGWATTKACFPVWWMRCFRVECWPFRCPAISMRHPIG